MQMTSERTVRELASANPSAARIFESFGIDYCCAGEKSLAEACSAAGADLREVADALDKPCAQESDRDWQAAALTELTQHIVEKHHTYVRDEIPRLNALIEKVVRVHGQNHPELLRVEQLFRSLGEELMAHLMKEERILFPYAEELERATQCGEVPTPSGFGIVQNPVRMMMMEHDSAGDLLHRMRKVASGYVAPQDACISYRILYQSLVEFELDLHQHIHLENNILFPRAVALDEQ